MEVAGSSSFAFTHDVGEEVRGAILLMGLTAPWFLKIPVWPASAERGGDEKPSTSAVAWRHDEFPNWGKQRKRSRTATTAGIHEADTMSWAEKKGLRRASPQSPLEVHNSALAIGGEECTRWSPPAKKVARSSSPAGVAVSVPPSIVRAPCAAAATAVAFPGDGFQFPTKMVESLEAILPIVRPAVKKMKKVELKAQKKWLLEERSKIQQELQELGKTVEVVKAERRELELRLKLPKTGAIAAEALKDDIQRHGMTRDIVPGTIQTLTVRPSECKQKDHIEIPDLNEPLPVSFD